MKCPYCISEIAHEALVCAVCRRDLYVVRPLLQRIAELEAELADLPARLVQAGQMQEQSLAVQREAEQARDDRRLRSLPAALACWVAPLLLLVGGHGLLSFVYDAPVVYLRLFALLVPLPFGFLFARYLRIPFGWGLAPAFLMAALAVLAMSGVTTAVDGVPLLPQNLQEGREFIEFAASIGFSFTTGLWLRHWQIERDERRRLAVLQAGLQRIGTVDGKKLSEKLGRVNDLGNGVVTLLTTGAALYTGLKQLVG